MWPLVEGCGAAFVVPVGWKDGSKSGRSGCMVVAFVSSVTRRPGGRLEKYFCLCCHVFVSISILLDTSGVKLPLQPKRPLQKRTQPHATLARVESAPSHTACNTTPCPPHQSHSDQSVADGNSDDMAHCNRRRKRSYYSPGSRLAGRSCRQRSRDFGGTFASSCTKAWEVVKVVAVVRRLLAFAHCGRILWS